MPEFHDPFCHPLDGNRSLLPSWMILSIKWDGFAGGVVEPGKKGSFVTGYNRDEL